MKQKRPINKKTYCVIRHPELGSGSQMSLSQILKSIQHDMNEKVQPCIRSYGLLADLTCLI